MQNTEVQQIICPLCGGTKFKQEITETYFRFINNRGKVVEYEDDYTRDLDAGIIRCTKCDADCSHSFDKIEIE